MVKNQITVNFDPEQLIFIERYANKHPDQIKEDIDVLKAIIDAGEKTINKLFDKNELALLSDAIDTRRYKPSAIVGWAYTFRIAVSDAIHLDHADKRHKVNANVLLDKMKKLKMLEALALYHLIRLS